MSRRALLRSVQPRKALTSAECIKLEEHYSANNYAPVPVVFASARGALVYDPEGKQYIDFLGAYGAVNQGHCHPKIIAAAQKQLAKVPLTSRAFHSDNFGTYSKFVTQYFGYDTVLPMNTGAEAVETALKIAKKWGYLKKKIPEGEAIIVCCTECFHGRTLACISMSDDPDSFGGYEPLASGIIRVTYGDAHALAKVLKKHGKKVAAFIAEPIQGEAGVKIPNAGYFRAVRELCDEHNVLFIADEVQSGLGRSGKMLAIEHEGVRPDLVVLAKALGGGVLPVSAVLADKSIMGVITPGTHGSTFGGNPLANAVAIASLQVLHEENLAQRSAKLGRELERGLKAIMKQYPIVTAVRCRGLFAAIDVDESAMHGKAGYKLMKMLAEYGVLSKTTHGHTLRLSPPLMIPRKLLQKALRILKGRVAKLQRLCIAEKNEEKLRFKKALGGKKTLLKRPSKSFAKTRVEE